MASQKDSCHEFNSDDLAKMGYNPHGGRLERKSAPPPAPIVFDECVILIDSMTQAPLVNVSYRFMDGPETVAEGRTDARGRTKRVSKDRAKTLELYVKGV